MKRKINKQDYREKLPEWSIWCSLWEPRWQTGIFVRRKAAEKKPKHVVRFWPGLSRYNEGVMKASILGLNPIRSAFPWLPQLAITISSYLYCFFPLLPSPKFFLRLPALRRKKEEKRQQITHCSPISLNSSLASCSHATSTSLRS